MNFIWVFTVCKSMCLGVSGIQRVNLLSARTKKYLDWKSICRWNSLRSAYSKRSSLIRIYFFGFLLQILYWLPGWIIPNSQLEDFILDSILRVNGQPMKKMAPATLVILYLQVMPFLSSADNLCKQFCPRLGPTGLDSVMVFLKEFLKKSADSKKADFFQI